MCFSVHTSFGRSFQVSVALLFVLSSPLQPAGICRTPLQQVIPCMSFLQWYQLPKRESAQMKLPSSSQRGETPMTHIAVFACRFLSSVFIKFTPPVPSAPNESGPFHGHGD